MKYQIAIGESKFEVDVGEIKEGVAHVHVNGKSFQVSIENCDEITSAKEIQPKKQTPAAATSSASSSSSSARPTAARVTPAIEGGAVVAPIPGLILQITVKVGDPVQVGKVVATMEAMKMENNITSNFAGTVREIRTGEGAQVSTGDVIMVIA